MVWAGLKYGARPTPSPAKKRRKGLPAAMAAIGNESCMQTGFSMATHEDTKQQSLRWRTDLLTGEKSNER